MELTEGPKYLVSYLNLRLCSVWGNCFNGSSTSSPKRLFCCFCFGLFPSSPYSKGECPPHHGVRSVRGCFISMPNHPARASCFPPFYRRIETAPFSSPVLLGLKPNTSADHVTRQIGKRTERRLETRQTGYFRRVRGTVSVAHNTS